MSRPECIICGFDSGGGLLCDNHRVKFPKLALALDERDNLIAKIIKLEIARDEQGVNMSNTLAPAAGPWRYDVENAPKDGSEVWGEFVIGTQVMKMAVRWDIKRKFWRNDYFSLMGNQLHAFATVNPPETPNHA